MRNFVAATVAATMIATSAFAATATVAPLPSCKAAGVSKAQDEDNTIWYIVAGGIVVGGIALVASGNSNGTLTTGTLATTTTTGT